MPQITVTLDDMTFMELTHNVPKGMKSAFVNQAVWHAIQTECEFFGMAMHAYAREGQQAAWKAVKVEKARRHEKQEDLKKWDKINRGEEE